jgi:hypothetical protein
MKFEEIKKAMSELDRLFLDKALEKILQKIPALIEF